MAMSAAQDAQTAKALQVAVAAAASAKSSAASASATVVNLNRIAANALYWQGAYSANVSYALYAVVTYSGVVYVSVAQGNRGHIPSSSPSQWVAMGGSGGGGTVYTTAPATGDGTVGSPITILGATDSTAGSMSAADKTKLDGLGAITPSLDHSTVLVAPSDTISVAGLNGDLEGEYLVNFSFTSNNLPGLHVQFMINGSASNLTSGHGDFAVGGGHSSDWVISNTAPFPFANNTGMSGLGRLSARSGRIRQFSYTGQTSDGNQDCIIMHGRWTDTGTLLTEFSLVADQADGFSVGDYLILTPLNNNA